MSKLELKWVLIWMIVIVLLSSLPYIIGLAAAPHGYQFLGLTHNIDDGAVYLSWTRQAADGHFFIKNLFTNEPQAARQFNLLFLAMGGFARIMSIPVIWVYHIFRCLLGMGLILIVYKFASLFLDKPAQRRLLIPIVGLSSGIGWLLPNAVAPTGSVDMWQPEAITFLSIYLNPLFLAGLILMIGSMYFLVLAQRTGQPVHAVYAGLFLLLLGNVHTYDVITVGCVWAAYMLVVWITERTFPTRAVLLSILAAAIAMPSVAYQFYLYSVDSVFRARANSLTPSPVIWSYFAGYGLVLLLAILGAVLSMKSERQATEVNSKSQIRNPGLLLVVWSVVGFIIPYIPIGQQRKLIMGLHVPLCILCVIGLSWLSARVPSELKRALFLLFIAFSMGSSVKFLANDANQVSIGLTAPGYAPYISDSELAAMLYLRNHAKPEDSILAPPTFALFIPAFTGHAVNYGHWSETPNYGDAVTRWRALGDTDLNYNAWFSLICESKSSYYVSDERQWDPRAEALRGNMSECFRDGAVRIYHIMSSSTRR
ncbi:MAG: hypothetical protein NT018_09020 [Armatimonadetes bacterium]|nr:hypothetical protein [Armatimonadota bacterium]